MKLKKMIVTFAKTAGLAAFAVVFGEIFIRIAEPQPLMPRYVTGTDFGVRGNVPGANYWHVTPEVTVNMRINSQRMRADREYAVEKPAGVCRAAIFGDSFFMGYELDLPDTFPLQAEQILANRGYNVEFLNFAVSGFGTAEMIRNYENLARPFSPDIVLFQLHKTDVADNLRANLFDFQDGVVTPTKRTYMPAVKLQDRLNRFALYRLVADNSHMYSFLREWASVEIRKVMASYRSAVSGKPVVADTEESDDVPQQPIGIELTGALLSYAQLEVTADGVEFLVVDVPGGFGTQVGASATLNVPPQKLAGLTIISPREKFLAAASQGTKLYYEKGHRHLTPKGAKIVAQLVADKLVQSSKLQSCRK